MSIDRKKYAKEVTQRFMQLPILLNALNIPGAETKELFLTTVNEYQQNYSQMRNGQRYATIDTIVLACMKWKVNPEWLLLGKGQVFK